MKFFSLCLLTLLSLPACFNISNPGAPQTPSVDAFGEANHVVVVCDHDLWDGPIGDSINYYFGSAYPILPQPEPLFDLRHMTYSDVVAVKTRRELRNYLFIADISRSDSANLKLLYELIGRERLKEHLETSKISNLITHDRWARGQQLMYILGKDINDLSTRIRTSFPAIAKQIRDFDQVKIKATTYAAGIHKGLSQKLGDRFTLELDIPTDWVLASEKSQGIWLRKEKEKSSSNIILGKIPYSSADQFTQTGLKKIRDTLSRVFVRTDSPGDFMEINDIDLPLFIYQKTIDKNYGIEARGIWETKIEFMGGPFQTYLIQTPKKDSLLYLDIFVYAPEMEKRDLMQQLEEIVRTLHFK